MLAVDAVSGQIVGIFVKILMSQGLNARLSCVETATGGKQVHVQIKRARHTTGRCYKALYAQHLNIGENISNKSNNNN